MSKKDLLITLPNKNLREKSNKVGLITKELHAVIKDMEAATLEWEASREHELGVALAAVQINQPVKIIIIRNDFDNKNDKTFSVFINPKVVKLEGEVQEDFEGCLSVTDLYGKVPRYSKVRVSAHDENGRKVRIKAEGFLARVFQHEIDHINGIMFVDHIKDDKDSFYKLTKAGKLEKLPYEKVSATNIFR